MDTVSKNKSYKCVRYLVIRDYSLIRDCPLLSPQHPQVYQS